MVLFIQIVAYADDQLIGAVAVQIRGPDTMAPEKLGVQDVAVSPRGAWVVIGYQPPQAAGTDPSFHFRTTIALGDYQSDIATVSAMRHSR